MTDKEKKSKSRRNSKNKPLNTFDINIAGTDNNDLSALEQKVKLIQNNKRILRRQILELEKNIDELNKEVSKLKKPPLLTGFVEEIFEKNELIIVKSTTGSTYAVSIKNLTLEGELKIGSTVSLNQRHFSIINALPPSSDTFITNLEVIEKPEVSFNDIGGLDTQIQEIIDSIKLPLEKPELFEKIGIPPPKGILLYGPPGSGKTLLAKAIAKETNCIFLNVVGSSLVQTFLGEGIRLVRELFEFAEKRSPAIIFIDELDAIGSKREITSAGDLEVQRTLMQLLSQLDGFNTNDKVKIIGSTNRLQVLDPALIRPGRFDKLIFIPMPNEEARRAIFSIYVSKINHNISEKDVIQLVKLSDGFTGADIKTICMEAGLHAIQNKKDTVTNKDFLIAYNKVSLTRNVYNINQDKTTYE